jgi:3',5'-cyclic AMP phosphodiesterase CpdA
MKKILHISDIHIGYNDFLDKFHKIVKKLNNGIAGNPSDIIIIITGDLLNDANKHESFKKTKDELDNLKKGGFEKILVVPGNHDYGTGSYGDKKFIKIFKKYFLKEDDTYPITNIIDDIAFIGLDSMAAELHWYDRLWAEGELGRKQLISLEKILRNKEIQFCKKRVIYLHHHPFDHKPFHQLKDSKKLGKILMNSIKDNITVDAILYGHNHEGKSKNGHWNIKRCYDAGSINQKPRSESKKKLPWYDKVKNSTRLIDLEKNTDNDKIINF